MFDSINMHMPQVIAMVVLLLAVLFAGFLVTIRIVGARIQEREASARPTNPDAADPPIQH